MAKAEGTWRSPNPASRAAAFAPPPYLPAPAVAVLPWTRHYVATVASRHGISAEDGWDEAMTALLRAGVYFRDGAGTFQAYAQRAVVRGLWRYCRRDALRARRGAHVSLDVPSVYLTAPSVELAASVLCDPVPPVARFAASVEAKKRATRARR